MDEKMSKENMVKEAVEEAKARAAMEDAADKPEEPLKDGEAAPDGDKPQEETEAAQEPGGGAEKESKKFGKKLKKDKKDKKEEMIEELKDRLLRQMAEFDNFRKRTEKEKAVMYDIGARDIIEKILPVIDNFERGLKAVPENGQDDPFAQGMEKIYKQLITTLTDLGVKPIEAVGNKFDPDFHNAVMHEENGDYGENEVIEEFQKGYTYHDIVIRYSMVKVVN